MEVLLVNPHFVARGDILVQLYGYMTDAPPPLRDVDRIALLIRDLAHYVKSKNLSYDQIESLTRELIDIDNDFDPPGGDRFESV